MLTSKSNSNHNAPKITPSSGRIVMTIIVAFVNLQSKVVATNAWIVIRHSVLSVLFLL